MFVQFSDKLVRISFLRVTIFLNTSELQFIFDNVVKPLEGHPWSSYTNKFYKLHNLFSIKMSIPIGKEFFHETKYLVCNW